MDQFFSYLAYPLQYKWVKSGQFYLYCVKSKQKFSAHCLHWEGPDIFFMIWFTRPDSSRHEQSLGNSSEEKLLSTKQKLQATMGSGCAAICLNWVGWEWAEQNNRNICQYSNIIINFIYTAHFKTQLKVKKKK